MRAAHASRLLGAALAAAVLAPAAVPAAASAAAETWPALNTATVFPDSTRPGDAPAAAEILAARGEAEGVQIAVRPDTALTVTPTVGDLTGPGVIPASRIQVYRVGYVRLSRPSTGVGALHGDGRYPDPLIPADGPVTIPGGETTPFYVLIDVPAEAPAGAYTGQVDLGPAGVVPLAVEVAPVTADRDGYPIVARLHVGNLAAAHGVEEDDPRFVRGLYDDLLPMLRAHGVSPGRAPMTTPKVDSLTGTLDFTNTLLGSRIRRDDNLRSFLAMGFTAVEVPFLPNFPAYGGVEDREYRQDAKRRATARSLSERYAEVIGRTYSLVVDEPRAEEYPAVNRAAAQLRSAQPSVPVMVTEAPTAHAVRTIGASVDIWTPPLWDLFKDPQGAARVTQQGKRLWWYTYGSDTQRYTPNVLIDKPTTEPRVLGWLAQKHGVQGFFYWGLNNWGGKSFTSPAVDPWYLSHTKAEVACGGRVREVGGNGEASLIWPGPGPERPAYGSLRLEALRDGAEDHSLLARLQAVDPALHARITEGVARPFTGTTDGEDGDACGDYARPGYLPVVETDPAALDAARQTMLARFSGKPLATLTGRVTTRATTESARAIRAQGTRTVGVPAAVVRFGTLETLTGPDGRWTLTGVPAAAGTLRVSRDADGAVDPVSVAVSRETIAAGGRVEVPPLPASTGRPVIGPGLGAFRATRAPARVRNVRGGLTLTVSNRYNARGESAFDAGGTTPSAEALYVRGKAGKPARNWSGYRYLDMTVQVTRNARPGQRWYLIVTPGGHYTNSRNLAVGRRLQNVRVDLRRPHPKKGRMRGMGDVRYLRFGLQSALPKAWRGGHAPTVGLRITNLRLVR